LTPIISESDDRNLGLIQAVAGTAIMMLLFSVSSVGAGILVEKDAGTLKRLLYSPISPVHILYGKMLAGNIIAVTQLSVMFLFSWIAFGLNIWIDIPSMMVMIMSTAFACTSFGIFLASISQTEKQVDSMATIVILVMSGIGGSMIPLFVMPEIMQKIAVVSMNYWGIQGFYDIFWRQLPFTDVIIRAGVLFSIGILMTAISTFFYRRNILRLA
jgi:ABC-type multidrug transport system permease subunit